MAPVSDTNSSDSGCDDMSDTIESSYPTVATTPLSPQTPKTKSKSSKRSIYITPTDCSMSRLNVETAELADYEVRSIGKDNEARDSPSPTKKRRISRLSGQEKNSGPFTSLFCKNPIFKVDENEKVLHFDDGNVNICGRVEYDLGQEKKKIEEVVKLFLDHVAFCVGDKQKKMAPKVGRSGSDTADTASLNILVDGEVHAKGETHGKSELAIRTEKSEKGIPSVQEREERAEMDITPLESLDVDMADSSEFTLGSENFSKAVQSVKERKERTEMALKTLELLNGEAETNSNKGLGEMLSLADGFERVIMRLKLEELALTKKESAEMYPKEIKTLNDEVGTGKGKTLVKTEILKSFILGRLEEDLQMLKETLETSFGRLERLNDKTEASFNKAKEAAQSSLDITSDAALLLENDREVRIPPANEDEVVNLEDIRDKIPEASTSTTGLLTNQESTSTQAGSPPGDTNQCTTYMRGVSLSRDTAEIPKPKDFNDEDAMFQQALIRSNYDEFLKSKLCACAFPCSHRNHINEDTNSATVEDEKEISSIFLGISGAEEDDDDDDEISDSCSSESDYTDVYLDGEGKSRLDKKKRGEKRDTERCG